MKIYGVRKLKARVASKPICSRKNNYFYLFILKKSKVKAQFRHN